MQHLEFFVEGRPVPQGSFAAIPNKHGGRPMLKQSNEKQWKAWRREIERTAEAAALRRPAAAKERLPLPHDGEVWVQARFAFERPLAHYGTGKNAHRLKLWAPARCADGRPGDLDKLQRALGDGLEAAGIVGNDKQIAHWNTSKEWCDRGEGEGVWVRLTFLEKHESAHTPSLEATDA